MKIQLFIRASLLFSLTILATVNSQENLLQKPQLNVRYDVLQSKFLLTRVVSDSDDKTPPGSDQLGV